MQRPALAPCSRKRGQKAPNWNQRTISSYDGTQRLPTSYKLLHFTKPGKLGLWGRRRSSRRCQWSKEPLHSSSPLEEFSPKIKIVFFCRKKIVFFSTWMASSAKVEGMSPDQSPAAYLHRAPIRFLGEIGRNKSMLACATWFWRSNMGVRCSQNTRQ